MQTYFVSMVINHIGYAAYPSGMCVTLNGKLSKWISRCT